MPHSAESDQDLYCLAVSLLWDAKHKWDKHDEISPPLSLTKLLMEFVCFVECSEIL